MSKPTNSKKIADNLITWIRDYASKNIDSLQIDEQGSFPPHIFLDLGNQGFFGIHISEQYGGLELTTFDILRIIEQVAAIDLTLALVLIESIQGAHTLEKYATNSMKHLYLKQVANGRIFTAGAMTESDAGSNPRAMKSTAKYNQENQWVLQGSKRWVGMGFSANLIAVYVNQFDAENNWQGMSGFLIPKDIEGLQIGPESMTMGIRGFSKNTIYMTDVKVSTEHLLGKEGGGMEIAQDNMMYIRLCLAAACIGAKKRCLQLMYCYAKQRMIATGCLLDNPVTLVRLSEITATVNTLDNFVYLIARFYDKNSTIVPEEALVISKVLCSESLGWVTDCLVQMLGARGYEEASGISKLYRDARAFRIFEGPTEALNMYIGSRALEKNITLEFFICNILKQKKIYNEMNSIINKIKKYYFDEKKDLFEKPFALNYWIQASVGEIISYGLVLAVTQYSLSENKSEDLQRSLIWIRKRYDEIIQKTKNFSCGEAVLLEANQIEKYITSYTNTIGNIEQLRQYRNVQVDLLLKPISKKITDQTNIEKSISSKTEINKHIVTSPDYLKEHQLQTSKSNYKKIEYSVLQLFEQQAAAHPHSIAIAFQDTSLSYETLNRQSTHLAQYLLSKGVKKDTLIAIYFERSIEMIISLLGVFKAGGAYLPLDYNYPEKSLKLMFEDSGANIILSHKKLLNDIPFKAKKVIFIEDVLEKPYTPNPVLNETKYSEDDLGYVIYTSGSSGEPKGVMLQHKVLSNLMNWHMNNVPGKRNVLQFTTLNFDMSFIEIFAALCSGGTLVLISEQDRLDISNFSKIINKYAIQQLILSVPFLVRLTETQLDIRTFSNLKEIIIAGEQLTITPTILTFFSRLNSCRLLNYYGPSETHVVTGYKFPKNISKWPDHVPIGVPIYNTKVLLLDEDNQEVSDGTMGEIHIGGISLAKGYVNRSELTHERFIIDPWEVNLNSRLYKTGDLGKYLPDRNLVFLGRKDEQLKIRGYRIEPQEIEWHLNQYPGIKSSVVVAKKSIFSDKHLEAYIVLDANITENFNSEIVSFLKEHLPSYMIPSKFNMIEHMPLTNSGKINRKALEEYDTSVTHSLDYTITSMTDTEKTIVEIIENIFKIKINPRDSFISVGGNSLLAMHIVAMLREKFSVELPVYTVLSDPTITHTANRIDVLLLKK